MNIYTILHTNKKNNYQNEIIDIPANKTPHFGFQTSSCEKMDVMQYLDVFAKQHNEDPNFWGNFIGRFREHCSIFKKIENRTFFAAILLYVYHYTQQQKIEFDFDY